MQKTKFNYNLDDKNSLLELAIEGLKDKINTLPIYKEGVTENDVNFDSYVVHIKREISIFEDIKFDGYMSLLHNMVNTAKQSGMFISCFGSVQYSLVAYLLDITEHFEFKKWREFINFTPFEKKPTVNIVASSYRIGEVISYIDSEYGDLIKKSTNKKVKFHDNLVLKFIDLGVDTKTRLYKEDVENLGLDIVEPDLNISNFQATISKENRLHLGLEALEIGDVLIYKIIEARELKNISFKDFDDLLKRIPLLAQMDKDILEKLSNNRAFIK